MDFRQRFSEQASFVLEGNYVTGEVRPGIPGAAFTGFNGYRLGLHLEVRPQ